jgi:hypothetical protein
MKVRGHYGELGAVFGLVHLATGDRARDDQGEQCHRGRGGKQHSAAHPHDRGRREGDERGRGDVGSERHQRHERKAALEAEHPEQRPGGKRDHHHPGHHHSPSIAPLRPAGRGLAHRHRA